MILLYTLFFSLCFSFLVHCNCGWITLEFENSEDGGYISYNCYQNFIDEFRPENLCQKRNMKLYLLRGSDRYLAKIGRFYFIYSLLLKILGPSGASSIYLKSDGDLLTSKWNLQRGLLGGSVHYKQNGIKKCGRFFKG